MDFEHFGLTGRPFQLTPDPRFWFETATHRKAMAYLGYGLAQGEGFMVITGDIGAGKTTLVGHLTDTIDRRRLHAIKLVSTALEPEDLLRVVAAELGVEPAAMPKAQLLLAIERGLHAVAREGKRVLLFVDEAQALTVGALEELRMLSNFQAGGHALLQIVLVGQPEFRERLHGSERLEQLRQRVIAIHHLDPMGEDEVADYVAHRLQVVGWRGRPDFAADAFPVLHAGSGGVPRRLNLLAGRVMLHAAVEGLELIDGAAVEAVVADLAADLPGPTPEPVVAELGAAPSWTTLATRGERHIPEPVADDPEAVSPPPDIEDAAAEPDAPAPAEPVGPEQVRDDREQEAEDGAPPPTEPAADPEVAIRIAALEARVEALDAALRRVLTLLVDWVEADAARPAAGAVVDSGPVPIRGAAVWDHAA